MSEPCHGDAACEIEVGFAFAVGEGSTFAFDEGGKEGVVAFEEHGFCIRGCCL